MRASSVSLPMTGGDVVSPACSARSPRAATAALSASSDADTSARQFHRCQAAERAPLRSRQDEEALEKPVRLVEALLELAGQHGDLGGGRGLARATSSDVRSMASGVRSSWEALATKRRCASKAVSKRARSPSKVSPRSFSSSAGPSRPEPQVEVLFRDMARGGGHRPKRPQHPAGDDPAEPDRHERHQPSAMPDSTSSRLRSSASATSPQKWRCCRPTGRPEPGRERRDLNATGPAPSWTPSLLATCLVGGRELDRARVGEGPRLNWIAPFGDLRVREAADPLGTHAFREHDQLLGVRDWDSESAETPAAVTDDFERSRERPARHQPVVDRQQAGAREQEEPVKRREPQAHRAPWQVHPGTWHQSGPPSHRSRLPPRR